MFNVRKYTSEDFEAWNSFLETAKNATFLFHRNFMEYHADRFEDFSLILFDEKDIVRALFPANRRKDGAVMSHQGLTYGGLIVGEEEKLNNILMYFQSFLRHLHEQGISKCYYKELPALYNTQPADEQQYALFILKANLYRRDSTLAIWQHARLPYQKRRKRSIKKAEKLGVEIREAPSFQEFWEQILVPNLQKRFGVDPVHSLEEISRLHGHFPSKIRQFNAYLNGEIMAGTTVFETARVAHAQYISASDEGRRNGSIDLLFHQLIQEEYDNKAYFDFGICNEENGMQVNHGLLNWKEGFGGRAISHNHYEIETANFQYLEAVTLS